MLAAAAGVEAHTRMVEIFRGTAGQGEAVGIRMNLDSSTTTAPVMDLTSTDMVCGRGGLTAVGRTVELAAGDTISMLHRAWADGGTGTAAPTTVAIPGHVTASEPSVTYDINVLPWTAYPEFGPTVYSNAVVTAELAKQQLVITRIVR